MYGHFMKKFVFVLVFVLTSAYGFSQELNCTVKVITAQLQTACSVELRHGR